jgi:hypothetical protein
MRVQCANDVFLYISSGLIIIILYPVVDIHGECIYSTWAKHVFTFGAITETHTIQDFRGDCEFICFKNPTCRGANVRRFVNGTIICELRCVLSSGGYINIGMKLHNATF